MLHCAEAGDRGRGVKWNLNVFVNHTENAVCVCVRVCVLEWESETEGEKEEDSEKDTRTHEPHVWSWSIVTNSWLLFILACDSQQPPHIRCEIGYG